MSRGELLFEENKVVDGAGGLGATTSAPGAWADEFAGEGGQQQQGLRPPGLAGNWEDEFARGVADIRIDEGEAAAALEHAWREGGGASGAMWADELAAAEGGVMGADSDWDRIFGGGGATAFDQGMSAQRDGKYVFSRDNPFLGDADAFAKGKDLFRRGVLTEAALALESEVTSRPSNAEAWRLLGTVHAENDDDPQAIAAMSSAQRADPSNLDVLLSLGVSHTNELASGEALQHLTTWLASNPQHVRIAAAAGPMPDSSQALSHTLRMFEAAAREAPQDFEVRVALGVLHHLGRQYSAAISAFEQALQLRPQDYSLWNKLGATLANNARSAEAIYAYQKALDLKPNYMRAWTNMGISFANLGDYDKSARFYVRALSLNPNATHVWGYLRTALACSGRMDLVDAVDAQDVGAVTAALPLLGQ
ncbi:hypothetical protein FOA52_013085 [Chlamydomonas sp. UWO 241]|nr:hypothetical protein FOA52_013085 [Chlamydomonas sp. UWO 241]